MSRTAVAGKSWVRIMEQTERGKVQLEVGCLGCKDKTTMTVPESGLRAWVGGELIQRALPSLTSDQREQLISGTCPSCWNQLFGEE